MTLRGGHAWLVVLAIGGCASTNDPSAEMIAPVNRGSGGDAGVVADVPIHRASTSSDAGTSVATGDASTPCGTFSDPVGATYPSASGSYFTFTYQGLAREFKIHVPRNYRNDTPIPVLYAFHGMTGNAESFGLVGTNLDANAEESGFLLVLPNGYDQSWNAGGCCGTAQQDNIDDVAFVREVHRSIQQDLGLCVDSNRVYATGYSNGAFLAYRLACEASDLFAAVVGVGGTMSISHSECAAAIKRPVPMLEIHGGLDVIAPFTGTDGHGAVASIEEMASLAGCSSTMVPTSVPRASFDTGCQTFPNCGGGAEVTLCEAYFGGHCWYGSPTCGTGKPLSALLGGYAIGINASHAVWEFVSRFSCSTCGR